MFYLRRLTSQKLDCFYLFLTNKNANLVEKVDENEGKEEEV